MNYGLVRPCAQCPFRVDIPGYLRRDRAVEIARALAGGATFACHKTTVVDEDDESERVATPDSQFCAGALLVMENEQYPNQAMRIAERVGIYDPLQLDKTVAVALSLAAFVEHHTHEMEDYGQTCSIVNSGCDAPAGYLINGVAVQGEGADYELSCCPSCGEPVCDNCMTANGFCPWCDEEEEE